MLPLVQVSELSDQWLSKYELKKLEIQGFKKFTKRFRMFLSIIVSTGGTPITERVTQLGVLSVSP